MKTTDLTQSETLRYIDAGIAHHKSDILAQTTPFEAKHYFAAGYAMEKTLVGLKSIEGMKSDVSLFVLAAIEGQNVGQSITVNDVVFTVVAKDLGVTVQTADGKLVAEIEFTSLDSPLKAHIGDDFVIYGQTMLRHALIGENQEQAYLIAPFYPLSLIMSAIGLASMPTPQQTTASNAH